MGKYHKMTHLSLLLTFGIALHLVENAFPLPLPVPGAKLGLANTISLMTLVIYGGKEALMVATLRSVLGSLLGGSLSSLIYSLSAAIVATVAMSTFHRLFKDTFSLVGISIIGGVAHSITQISVASIILATWGLYVYLPVLLMLGLITCFFTGLAVFYVKQNLGNAFERKKPQGGGQKS